MGAIIEDDVDLENACGYVFQSIFSLSCKRRPFDVSNEAKRFLFDNSSDQSQEFFYETRNEYIVLIQYLSRNIICIEIPREIENKPVAIIGESCFRNHPEIQHITFPDTVLEIGEWAFSECRSLEELILPDSITEIGNAAFVDCRSLKKVKMPKI